MKAEVTGAQSIRMFVRSPEIRVGRRITVFNGNAILPGEPPAQVDQFAALRTEGSVGILHIPGDRLATLRAINYQRAPIPCFHHHTLQNVNSNSMSVSLTWRREPELVAKRMLIAYLLALISGE